MASLAGITLPDDLDWPDEYRWSPVAQNVTITLSGALVIQEDAQQAGRPMTLTGSQTRAWTPRQAVEALRALAAQPATQHTLNYRGANYTVVFNRQNGEPVEAEPIVPFADPDDADHYRLTLRLMQV
ncbi:MAG: hypothetical protein ABF296_09420 [Oceanococcaceae bacterium]